VLLNRRGEHRRDQVRNANGSGECDGAPDRIALVRQRRRPAASGRGRLERFADFGLREQRNIAGQLSERRDDEAECGRQLVDPVALRVPGHVGQRQLEFRGERGFDGRPLSPSDASVPEAPPNCSTSSRERRAFIRTW
jgi:hypothetical protein